MDQNGSFVSPYMSPQGAAAQREYAKALMYGSGDKGPQFKNVQSWTQGVSNMVNALMGGNAMYGANRTDQNAINNSIGKAPGTAPATSSFDEGPSSEGQTKSDAGDMSKESNAIASIESQGSGGYNAIGPQTKYGKAYGKYQVMEGNIPSWTKEVLGQSMSPQEFLQNPQAQEAVFKTKFAQGGDNDADRASVWFTGKKAAQGANRVDPTSGMTGSDYVNKFMKGMGQGGMPSGAPGSTAVSFTGTSDGNPAPAVQAINSAINPQMAQNTPVAVRGGGSIPSPMQQPNGTGIYIDPRLVQKRPQMDPNQVRAIMNSPVLTPEAKSQYLQQFQQQNQPIEVPYQGGKVIIDPNNPTRQQFVAPEIHYGEKKIGDIQGPIGLIPDGKGGLIQQPIARPQVGPQSQAVPTAAPGGTPTPTPVTAQNAPPAPAGPTNAAPQATAFAGQPAEGTTTGTAKPIIPVANPQSPTSPFEKFAQNMPAPPGVDPEDWAAYTQKKSFDIKQNVNEDAQKKAADFSAKKYDLQSAQAQAARKQMPNLDMALAMMNNPNFHSGLLSGAQDTWARFKSAALGDAGANAPNEAFDKIMAATVLGGIKDVGGGQIRNAEIALLGKANANRNNTDASNRAVLEVSRRALQTTDHLDQIGQEYASGSEVHDPVTGEVLLKENVGADGETTPRHGLDVGYDKLARKYMKDHPSFNPDEIKHYETIFDTGKNPDDVQTPNEQGKGGQSPAIGTEKQFKQGTGVWNGTEWVAKGK